MYQPSAALLQKYADVCIRFALNSGTGVKKNEVVLIATQLPGLPLARIMYQTVLACGANPILQIIDDHAKQIQIRHATDDQLLFFPQKYYRGLADTIDHWVRVLADEDPQFLKDEDPRKIILAQKSAKPFREWLDQKEDKGKFTWTLCLYGTPGQAAEAGLTLEQYWKQIRAACYLDKPDPIAHWRKTFAQVQRLIKTLSAMPIDKLHIESVKTDLWITLGQNRQWLGGSGRNIPSFEIFTSPDWRGTNGKIFFDLPLYRFGNIIKDISLEFKDGKIIKATAAKNEKLLKMMIAQENANKIGEFSLTDRRFSNISAFMADTLYDENFGGNFGNTHLAVGKSYHDTCTIDGKKMTKKRYEQLGFNDSVEHTDIIATNDRTVTAVLKDGSKKVIYTHGQFTI